MSVFYLLSVPSIGRHAREHLQLALTAFASIPPGREPPATASQRQCSTWLSPRSPRIVVSPAPSANVYRFHHCASSSGRAQRIAVASSRLHDRDCINASIRRSRAELFATAPWMARRGIPPRISRVVYVSSPCLVVYVPSPWIWWFLVPFRH